MTQDKNALQVYQGAKIGFINKIPVGTKLRVEKYAKLRVKR